MPIQVVPGIEISKISTWLKIKNRNMSDGK
jgi:hypothetical protein